MFANKWGECGLLGPSLYLSSCSQNHMNHLRFYSGILVLWSILLCLMLRLSVALCWLCWLRRKLSSHCYWMSGGQEILEPPVCASPSILPISAPSSTDVRSQDLGDHFHPLQALANLSHLIMCRSLRGVYQRLMWGQSTSKINGTKMILAIAENGARELYS